MSDVPAVITLPDEIEMPRPATTRLATAPRALEYRTAEDAPAPTPEEVLRALRDNYARVAIAKLQSDEGWPEVARDIAKRQLSTEDGAVLFADSMLSMIARWKDAVRAATNMPCYKDAVAGTAGLTPEQMPAFFTDLIRQRSPGIAELDEATFEWDIAPIRIEDGPEAAKETEELLRSVAQEYGYPLSLAEAREWEERNEAQGEYERRNPPRIYGHARSM